MKKLAACILCASMAASLLAGCGGSSESDGTAGAQGGDTKTGQESSDKSNVINVWAFTDEVPGMIEKYKEIRTLLESLEIPTQFAALGASNAFQFQGTLPEDKDTLAAALDKIIETVKEDDLREYRVNLRHL